MSNIAFNSLNFEYANMQISLYPMNYDVKIDTINDDKKGEIDDLSRELFLVFN